MLTKQYNYSRRDYLENPQEILLEKSSENPLENPQKNPIENPQEFLGIHPIIIY